MATGNFSGFHFLSCDDLLRDIKAAQVTDTLALDLNLMMVVTTNIRKLDISPEGVHGTVIGGALGSLCKVGAVCPLATL
jgi:hypothetical protein